MQALISLTAALLLVLWLLLIAAVGASCWALLLMLLAWAFSLPLTALQAFVAGFVLMVVLNMVKAKSK